MKHAQTWPLRKIVEREPVPLVGTVELRLDCGHTEFRQLSQEPAHRARCWWCYLESLK